MKTLSLSRRSRSAGAVVPCARRGVSAGFTLVEMLVVIAIIAILASLITVVALRARITAKNAVIAMELKTGLEGACQQYKMQFGEYPPDFTDLSWPGPISRHLAKAFPRYSPLANLAAFKTATGLTDADLTPFSALTFWLGGIRDANGMPSGFAADQTNPFQPPSACASRIGPFHEFDPNRLAGYKYWPQGAEGDKTTGAIVYFRAENGSYLAAVTWANNNLDTDGIGRVYPAQDSKRSTKVGVNWNPVWINPKSFQIFSSGLGVKYGNPGGALNFPSGDVENPDNGGVGYTTDTYDDVTNFSSGTLEAAIPQ